jgi:hypothetical protein
MRLAGTKRRFAAPLALTLASVLVAGALTLHDPRVHQRTGAGSLRTSAVQQVAKIATAADPTCAACLLQAQTTGIGPAAAQPLTPLVCRGLSPVARFAAPSHAFVHSGSPRAPPSFLSVA